MEEQTRGTSVQMQIRNASLETFPGCVSLRVGEAEPSGLMHLSAARGCLSARICLYANARGEEDIALHRARTGTWVMVDPSIVGISTARYVNKRR